MNLYRIHWRSNVTGQVGRGGLTFEKEKAEELCRELNFDFPEIVHEAVLVEGIANAHKQNQNNDPAPATNKRPSGVRNKNADKTQYK